MDPRTLLKLNPGDDKPDFNDMINIDDLNEGMREYIAIEIGDQKGIRDSVKRNRRGDNVSHFLLYSGVMLHNIWRRYEKLSIYVCLNGVMNCGNTYLYKCADVDR